MPALPQPLPDTEEDVEEEEAGSREAHVVPVVQGGHPTCREVLKGPRMKDTYRSVACDAVLVLRVLESLMPQNPGLAEIVGSLADRIGNLDNPRKQVADISEPEVKCGKSDGTIPKSVRKPSRFRLVELGSAGIPTGYVDEGMAAELGNRNKIAPSTIYRIAGTGKVVNGFCVERMNE